MTHVIAHRISIFHTLPNNGDVSMTIYLIDDANAMSGKHRHTILPV